MEFQDELAESDQLFHEQHGDGFHPPDNELLAIQKRKSMPKVVIEEFVQVDADSSEEEEKKTEPTTEAPMKSQKKQLTKLRTHHEITDFGLLVKQDPK